MNGRTPQADVDRGGLTLLGRSIKSPVFELLRAAAKGQEGPKLETFPAEPGLAVASARIECLVSWCPQTHQIDYYVPVEISYAPRDRCIESKSLKLYGEWFLTRASFAEALAVDIARDVYEATDAQWVKVVLHQAVRGGIRIAAEAYLPAGNGAPQPSPSDPSRADPAPDRELRPS